MAGFGPATFSDGGPDLEHGGLGSIPRFPGPVNDTARVPGARLALQSRPYVLPILSVHVD